MEMIQDWFVHISTQVHTEVPAELVNSIQEVIADSSPGLAVNRMREELDEIRDSLDSSKAPSSALSSERCSNSWAIAIARSFSASVVIALGW